jgi:hypothetical protein
MFTAFLRRSSVTRLISRADDDPRGETGPEGVYRKDEKLEEFVVRLSHEVQMTYRLHHHCEFLFHRMVIIHLILDFAAETPQRGECP